MRRLLCALFAALPLAFAAPAHAGTANAGVAGASAADPLAGLPWGNYTSSDEVFDGYRQLSPGRDKQLLAKIALRPRMRWFGAWYHDPAFTAGEYIGNVTGGNTNVLVQMAIFRLVPWEHEACTRLPTAGEQSSYKSWIRTWARAIGSTRVALVLQPDLPFAACIPQHSRIPLQLVGFAARTFSALPHTTVYIDAGAGDWASVGEASYQLRVAGVKYARGFALNDTHYDTTENEIRYGARLVRALAAAGVPGRHFVVNTSSNGRGFTFQQYHGQSFDNAAVCRTRTQRRCVTLGIPPTTDIANARWGLSAKARKIAAREVDAYMWIGRPWLHNQADPFDLQRSVQMAATTPF